jgi:electron transfer flavoprotein beta subunit
MLLDRADARSEINPPDMNALEMALSVKDRYGGRVSILSMGPPHFEPLLRVALAMGCDHIYLLSDRAFAGADTLATTYTLAQGVHKMGGADLIFCGEESSDGATGQVPPGLAEWLGIAQLTLLSEIDLDPARRVSRGRRELKGGYQILEVPMPCVVSVKTAVNEPRFMDYRIKPWAFETGRVTVWTETDLEMDETCIGLTGSPTVVTGLAQAPSRARRREFLEGSPEQIARELASLLQNVL